MFSRRGFLGALFVPVAGALGVHKTFLGETVKEDPILVSFKTHFPQTMTRAEFEREQQNFVKVDAMISQVEKFSAEGKILRTYPLEVFGDHSVWKVAFKSIDAYFEWMNLAVNSRFLENPDALEKELGYHFEVLVHPLKEHV